MHKIKAILEALAVGDAMGMPTEFMTQEDIDAIFPPITALLDPKRSYTHNDLPFASVTDDTEQNLYLAKAYVEAGEITIEHSADALSRWIVECDAVAKKYIGPSSLKALNAIRDGVDVMEAGKSGTTNGGIMRTPALVLCAGNCDEDGLLEAVRRGCIPTHHTSQAIEAAAGYGFALRAAMEGKTLEEILSAAKYGAEKGLRSVEYVAAAPTCARRLDHIRAMEYTDEQKLLCLWNRPCIHRRVRRSHGHLCHEEGGCLWRYLPGCFPGRRYRYHWCTGGRPLRGLRRGP